MSNIEKMLSVSLTHAPVEHFDDVKDYLIGRDLDYFLYIPDTKEELSKVYPDWLWYIMQKARSLGCQYIHLSPEDGAIHTDLRLFDWDI